ncbi:hypothetical protein V5O48_011207 [Marasmius crinis-equi]|uniref:T6SS Phospholipase effector Tle1-like catalytic domain-containing protein n=1 Tax=Marasmius crinis-equi TaxID=585013 RepID=A0ABR3F678_9AGAR
MAHERTETAVSNSPTVSNPPQYFENGHRTKSPERLDISSNLEDVIPDPNERRYRTLILCFDGTGDQFDDDNSNVVNFFSMLKKDDPRLQLVYYQTGIGTYTTPQIARPLKAKFQKILDMMIGVSLDAHVMGGYEFLMQNYEAGDKICIFGFSRGAYTARALAGMIHKVGLLPRCNHQQVPFAYKMYSREDETGWKQSGAFKQAFSIDVDIELVGVWDTVGSVGVIPKRLPFTTSNTHVKYFRHAIALDEHRARFMPNLWQHQPKDQCYLGLPPGAMPKSRTRPKPVSQKAGSKSITELERKYSGDGDLTTNVEEVWFAGCHCDVGGGAVSNSTRNNLARIPLRWMIRQCFLLNTGILFHGGILKRPATASSAVTENSRLAFWTDDFVNEEQEDLRDVLSPINDMLEKKPAWWILELVPQRLRYQKDEDYSWVQRIIWGNMGRPRHIPHKHGVKVHRTVKMRMEAEVEALETKRKYVPKPKWQFDPIWVD